MTSNNKRDYNMEPKNPIIIDEVDVSGCEFYYDKYCNCSDDRNEQLPFAAFCSEYSNCMFKQLARKEKENQRYGQALIVIEDIVKEQIPYLNIDEPKTMTEIEYDYAGKIYVLEQRMNKILQKISEVLDE